MLDGIFRSFSDELPTRFSDRLQDIGVTLEDALVYMFLKGCERDRNDNLHLKKEDTCQPNEWMVRKWGVGPLAGA